MRHLTYTIKKSLLLLLIFTLLYSSVQIVLADPVTTSVTVGNQSPVFAISTFEDPESSTTNRTDVGNDITFRATGSDSNLESYYLIICSTNSVTPNNSSAPNCGGTQYCISGLTNSGTQANCTYSAQSSDSESNNWYSFVCDDHPSSAACSTSDQGSGATGSPFIVNHPPTIDSINNTGSANPGGTITFSAGAGTSDPDTLGGQEQVKIVVCKTAGISGGTCDGGSGDTWCESGYVDSQPTCDLILSNPFPDATYDAYVYVVDENGLESDSASNGSNQQFTVNNIAPTLSSLQINSGVDVTLTEDTNTNIIIQVTITDNNSCLDIDTVEASFYRSGVGYSACDTIGESNANNCYPTISCSVVGSGDTCSGTSDASADYQCTVSIQYHADPTDAATEYTAEEWLATFIATDNNAQIDSQEISSGIEILSLVGYSVTNTISFGSLNVGEANDPLDKITVVTATGNVGIDEELSGADMTDGGSNTIGVENQKYSLSASTAYSAATALSITPTEIELNVPKTTITLSPEEKNTWWGIEIPLATVPGIYTGSNSVVAVKSEVIDW